MFTMANHRSTLTSTDGCQLTRVSSILVPASAVVFIFVPPSSPFVSFY